MITASVMKGLNKEFYYLHFLANMHFLLYLYLRETGYLLQITEAEKNKNIVRQVFKSLCQQKPFREIRQIVEEKFCEKKLP